MSMFDHHNIMRSWRHTPRDTKSKVSEFLTAAGRRYILGRNEHAAALLNTIDVDGVIDDFSEPGTVWNGCPVLKGDEVPTRAIVVNCSTSISPVSAARRLASLNIKGVLPYADLCRIYPERFPLPSFVKETREDLEQNVSHWQELANSLADQESRRVLDDVLQFRMTGDYRVMNGHSVRIREQYFEDFLNLTKGEIFVDAGGFDGDTTEEFCKRCPDYGKVLFFEPSIDNLSKARIRLKGLRDIQFLDMGLSDVAGVLSFDPDVGSASAVNESGSHQICVTTLDMQVQEAVSLIKMDLEGWELKALAGSRKHIAEDHPKLAIAVYHHSSDFWKVFDFVMQNRNDYSVYLRHYTEGWSETVMYFISTEEGK